MILQKFGPMTFRPYPKGVGTFVLLAGAELNHFRRFLIANKVKGILFSFYYIRKWLKKGACSIDDLKADAMRADYCFIDSGGFTLQKAVTSGKLDIDIHSYIREYYEFAEEMKPYVQVFGAVDSVSNSGGFTMEDMDRAVYEARSRGIHIAPTIFGEEDAESLRKSGYMSAFDMVALSSKKKNMRAKAQGLFGQLRRFGMKVHGYAMTSQEEFRAFDFFSVDSSTWLGGQKYGTTYVWRGGKMRTYGFQYKARIRPTLYALCKEHGVDFEKVKEDTYVGKDGAKRDQSMSQDILDEINKMNLIAWKQLVDYYLNITNRAYWLKQTAPIFVDENGQPIREERGMESQADDLLSRLGRSPKEQEPVDGEVMEAEVFEDQEDGDEEEAQESEDTALTADLLPFHSKVPMKCNDCTIFSLCPKGKTDQECQYSFDELFQMLNPKAAIRNSALHIIQLQFDRIQRAALFEKANGGAIDSQLSTEISRYMNLLLNLKSLQQDTTNTFSITASGKAAEQVTQSGGLLSKLLMDK